MSQSWVSASRSSVGAHLLATAKADGVDVLYWNVGAKEVDCVLCKGDALAALEVKTTDADSISGMKEFKAKYPRLLRVCGMSIDFCGCESQKSIDFRDADLL